MSVTVRYFAAAAEAMGADREQASGTTVTEVLSFLERRHGPHVRDIADRCTIMVDGQRIADHSHAVSEAAIVDLLPPFAGG